MIYSGEALGGGCNLLMLHCTDVLQQCDAMGQKLPRRLEAAVSALPPIVLQKSKVAGRLIFREITKREAIADSYNLNRVTEVACEFNVRR
jgi:hypothetical protein